MMSNGNRGGFNSNISENNFKIDKIASIGSKTSMIGGTTGIPKSNLNSNDFKSTFSNQSMLN